VKARGSVSEWPVDQKEGDERDKREEKNSESNCGEK
jgi:hypothetical protein